MCSGRRSERCAAKLCDVIDDLLERRELCHGRGFDLWQTRHALLHGAKDLDALDRVDAEVGFQLHREIEHLFWVTGFLGNDLEHDLGQVDARCRSSRWRCGSDRSGGRCRSWRTSERRAAELSDVIDDLLQGRELCHRGGLDLWQTRDALLHGAKDLDAFDRVDAEVGFQLHREVEHLFRVTCLLCNHRQHHRRQIDAGFCRRCWSRLGDRSRWRWRRSLCDWCRWLARHRRRHRRRAHWSAHLHGRCWPGDRRRVRGRSKRSACLCARAANAIAIDMVTIGRRCEVREGHLPDDIIRRDWLAGRAPREVGQRRLRHVEERRVALCHHALILGLRARRLLLHTLEGIEPAAIDHRRCRYGSRSRRWRVCWRMRVTIRDGHGDLDDPLDLDLDDLLDDAWLVDARCGCGCFGGRLSEGRWLAVVCAAELDGKARRLALTRIIELLVTLPQQGEVELETCGEHLRERQREHLHAVLAAAIGRDDVEVIALERASHEVREHRLGANLDEGANASVVHRLELLDKAHRLRDLPGEQGAHLICILGINIRGAVGVDCKVWRRKRDIIEEALERRARVADKRRVERGRDLESLVLHPGFCQALFDLLDGARGARENNLRGAVVVRDDDIDAPLFESRDDGIDIRDNRGHRAVEIRCSGHQLPALARDAEEVLLGVNARVVERGEFAKAVPGDHVGANAHGVEQGANAEARGANGRLCPLGGGDLLALALGLGLAPWRPREDDIVQRVVLIERHIRGAIPNPEHALEVDGELVAHVHVLASLAREEERDLSGVAAVRVLDAVWRAVIARRRALEVRVDKLELLLEVVAVVCHHGQLQRLASSDVLLRLAREELEHIIVVVDVVHHLVHAGDEFAGRIRRPDEQLARLRAHAPLATCALVLLERDVEVRATETERTDRRAAWVLRATHPGARGRVQVEGAIVDIDHRVGLVDLDGRRDNAMVERHGDLEETRRPGGGLGVADL